MSATMAGSTEPPDFIKPPQCREAGKAFHPRHYRQIASPLTRKSFPSAWLDFQTLVRSKPAFSPQLPDELFKVFPRFFPPAASLFMISTSLSMARPMLEREVAGTRF